MTTLTDRFGEAVTVNGDGSYTRGGVTVEAISDAAALTTFDAMAPDGWQPPAPPPLTVIPVTMFMASFTRAELLGIFTARQTNPEVDLWITTLLAGQSVDLSDPVLAADMEDVVALGLLTEARATAILTPL